MTLIIINREKIDVSLLTEFLVGYLTLFYNQNITKRNIKYCVL